MRVLVVEDETTPRETLRDRIPWASLGFTRVDTARNGIDALEQLGDRGADLVLTDIRMPKMDGIELALEVHGRWPSTVLIFLSGHSDKEYLKTAIRVQALDYLDKPIDLVLVEEAVARASRAIREERSKKSLVSLRRQSLAQSLLAGALPPGEGDERFSRGPMRALVLDPGRSSEGWVSRVLALINGDPPMDDRLVAASWGSRLAVFADRTLGAEEFDAAASRWLERLDAVEPDARIRLGFSPPVAGPSQLPEALLEAEAALTEAYYRPEGRLFGSRPPSGRTFELSEEVLSAWREAMARQDHSWVFRQLELLEQRAAVARDPVRERVDGTWLGALGLVLEFVPGWGGAERSSRLDKLAKDLAACASLAEAAQVVRDCFSRLFLAKPETLAVADRVERAKRFIENHFVDPDLAVDKVAAHVGYSESYFCTVFKQALGSTVKDYVTRVRIDRAKAYLWDSEPRSMADLALRVGFRDPNYFSTVFRRITGVSPGAYRKKALG